jgi:hypothetical protein
MSVLAHYSSEILGIENMMATQCTIGRLGEFPAHWEPYGKNVPGRELSFVPVEKLDPKRGATVMSVPPRHHCQGATLTRSPKGGGAIGGRASNCCSQDTILQARRTMIHRGACVTSRCRMPTYRQQACFPGDFSLPAEPSTSIPQNAGTAVHAGSGSMSFAR